MQDDSGEQTDLAPREEPIDQLARSLSNAAPRRTALHPMAAAGAGLLGALGVAGALADQTPGDRGQSSQR